MHQHSRVVLPLLLSIFMVLFIPDAQGKAIEDLFPLAPGHYGAVAAQTTEGAYPGETIISRVNLLIEITRIDVSGHVWGRISLDRELGSANGYIDKDNVLHLTGTLKHPVLSGERSFILTAMVSENGLIHGYYRKESHSLMSSGAFNRALPVKK